MPRRLADADEQRFWDGVAATSRFFRRDDSVHGALRKLADRLEQQQIPYAIVGAMALNEAGYRRATVGVDVLLTAEGLDRFKRANLGRGYHEKAPGSRNLRDKEYGVDVHVVLAGGYPGDGKPKPVAFPDPAAEAERGTGVALLPDRRVTVGARPR